MRNEEQVLKDFEKLGYEVCENNSNHLKLQKYTFIIEVSKNDTFCTCHDEDYQWSFYINLEEIKLLHELFEIWEGKYENNN